MARGPNEKNFSGDIPNGLADEVEDFITSHRDVKKKQVLAVALDLFMSLPEPAQAMLMFTRHGEAPFQEIVGRVRGALGDDKDIAPTPEEVCRLFVLLSDDEKPRAIEMLRGMVAADDAGKTKGLPQQKPRSHRRAKDV